MATDLTNVAVSTGFTQLLHIDGGIGGSVNRIYDGDGTGSPLEISSTTVQIKDGSFDFNVASHDGTNGLKLGGTLVTASATELNYVDVSSIGTAEASKAIILDSNKDITGIRNLTATGTIQAANFTGTGNTTIGNAADDTIAMNATITTDLIFEGSSADANELTLTPGNPGSDITITLPSATDTLVGRATSDTLTNKGIDADNNTLSNIEVDNLKSGVLDTDISSVSGSDDTIASAKAIKAYVDAQVTAQDLDATTDSGTIAIDLDSETLTIAGGEGIDTSATSNTITIAGEDASTSNKGVASFSSDNFDVSSGAVTIKDNGVILATETTGDYVQNITGGTGIDSTGATSGENIAHTLSIDLNELTTETSIADDDFIAMVDATDSASGKITFENLEDAIFASVSGDIAIAEDGTATIQANSVAMATDTTGDFVNSITAGTGLTSTGATSGENISHSLSVDAAQTQITSVGTLNAGAISSGFGNIDIGSSTANFGATTVDSLSVSDGNITNVGDIALDSISADGNDINVAITDNRASAFEIKQGSDKYFGINTTTSGDVIQIGTGISGTAITIGHSTSETTIADNLTITGNLKVNGDQVIQNVSTMAVNDPIISLQTGTDGAALGADTNKDVGLAMFYHTGSAAKTAFLGFDDSAGKLTFVPDATISSEVVSGSVGTMVANLEGDVTGDVTGTIQTAAQTNITSVGALGGGSITSGFGAIDTGSSNITTTGVGTFGSLDISGDVDVDGTLEADAITVNSTALDEFISDTVGAMVGSNTETGIAVTYDDSDNTLDFVLGASQTSLTSVLNASLVAGRDADNQIKFSTDDQIIFRVAGGDGVTMKASGEIEATSLDISGDIDVDGTTNLDVVAVSDVLTVDKSISAGDLNTAPIVTFKNSQGSGHYTAIKFEGADDSGANTGFLGYMSHNTASTRRFVFSHDGTTRDVAINGDGSVDFNGAVDIASTLAASGSTGSNYIGSFTNTSATGWGLFVKGGADNADYSLRVQDKDANDLLAVKSGGNIGIGTHDPNTALHLKFTDNSTNSTDNSSLTHSSGIYINNESTTNEAHSSVGFRTNNLDGALSMIYGGSDNQGRMSVNMEGAERLVITHDGNVGIGTTDPGYQMELRSNDTSVTTPRLVIRQIGSGDASLAFQVPDSPHGWVMGCDQSSDECFVLGTGVGNLASAKKFQVNTTGFVTINDNDTGSAGSTLKQLSLGDSSSTQFDATNVASFTGMVLSNSYTSGSNQSGTATGIAFTHHASSSGISYIASVAGSNSGDRSSLYFGTRGSGGVEERLRLEDNGEIFLGKGGDGYVRHYEVGGSNYWYLYATNSDKYNFNYNASGTPEMVISTSGNVTILGSLTEGSDIRLKENVETIPNALSKVNQMRGVSYNRIGEDEVRIGMVADEVEKIIPELVRIEPNEDVKGLENLKSLAYADTVAVLVEAIKELTAKVEALENA